MWRVKDERRNEGKMEERRKKGKKGRSGKKRKIIIDV